MNNRFWEHICTDIGIALAISLVANNLLPNSIAPIWWIVTSSFVGGLLLSQLVPLWIEQTKERFKEYS